MNGNPVREIAHSLIIEGRQKCSISGVNEVLSFDEQEIVMETNRGMLTIGGSELHVERLSLDIGELALEGQIDAVIYTEEKGRKRGLWAKLF